MLGPEMDLVCAFVFGPGRVGLINSEYSVVNQWLRLHAKIRSRGEEFQLGCCCSS